MQGESQCSLLHKTIIQEKEKLMEINKNRIYRIAIDAMGGDLAPDNEIQGAILASKNKKFDIDFEIIFIGNETQIRQSLTQYDTNGLRYSIVHADETITMDDDPTEILKKKPNSSLHKGLQYHAQGYADSFISIGNTGAVLSVATVTLGRINGVSRPTIGALFPTIGKKPTLILDVGANIEAKSRFLYEFAVMGSIYVNLTQGIENPRIGLLNIGEESSKGTEEIIKTYDLLKNSNMNFIGNIEGRDILLGSADVVVCDGFTGNVILKFAESITGLLKTKIKNYSKSSIFKKLLTLTALPVLKNIFRDFDYQEYGGVPLLGVNGIVLIGHGKSSPKAISNIIFRAIELIRQEINPKIENSLSPKVMSNNG